MEPKDLLPLNYYVRRFAWHGDEVIFMSNVFVEEEIVTYSSSVKRPNNPSQTCFIHDLRPATEEEIKRYNYHHVTIDSYFVVINEASEYKGQCLKVTDYDQDEAFFEGVDESISLSDVRLALLTEIYPNCNYKGELTGKPTQIVEVMLSYQNKEYGYKDTTPFEENITAGYKAFSWTLTIEGHNFWERILKYGKVDDFYKKYNKCDMEDTIFFLKDLQEPYKSLAFELAKKIKDKPEDEYTRTDFVWAESTQGYNFWLAVFNGVTPSPYPVKIKSVDQELKEGEKGVLGWVAVEKNKVINSTELKTYISDIKGIDLLEDQEVADWINSHTLLSKSLIGRLKNETCNEEIKNYILSMEYSIDMNFISYKIENDSITFLPKGKVQEWNDDKWKINNRQETTPHKFFNKILKGKFEEYDIKCFADELQAADAYNVEFVSGQDIASYYQTIETDSWATSSCMEGKDEEVYLVYTENNFELGIIRDSSSNEIVGRFLRVTADDGFEFCDRVYYESEKVLSFFKAWCDKNGQTRKEHQSYDSKRSFYNKIQGSFERNVEVSLSDSPSNYGYMPYMDTLSYGKLRERTIKNYYERGDYEYTSTDGYLEDADREFCIVNQEYYDREDMCVIDFGVHEGEWVHQDDAYYSDINNGYCVR